jgi:hypothetical protein
MTLSRVEHSYPPEWRELYESVNGRTMFGQRGVRDPEHPCEMFDPVDDIDWLGLSIEAPGTGSCDSDGHYLCNGCSHLSMRRIEEIVDPAAIEAPAAVEAFATWCARP